MPDKIRQSAAIISLSFHTFVVLLFGWQDGIMSIADFFENTSTGG